MKGETNMKCTLNKINHAQRKETTTMSNYGNIDAKTLKNLIDSHTSMEVVDARTQEWDDGRRITGAKSLPANSSPEKIKQVVPDKDSLVVVYCGSYRCPLGKRLSEKLIDQGYKHVLEYAGGISEWADTLNNPIERESI